MMNAQVKGGSGSVIVLVVELGADSVEFRFKGPLARCMHGVDWQDPATEQRVADSVAQLAFELARILRTVPDSEAGG